MPRRAAALLAERPGHFEGRCDPWLYRVDDVVTDASATERVLVEALGLSLPS